MSEHALPAAVSVEEHSEDGDPLIQAKGRRPPPMIEVESVRRAKRAIALVTTWVPTLGTVAARSDGARESRQGADVNC